MLSIYLVYSNNTQHKGAKKRGNFWKAQEIKVDGSLPKIPHTSPKKRGSATALHDSPLVSPMFITMMKVILCFVLFAQSVKSSKYTSSSMWISQTVQVKKIILIGKKSENVVKIKHGSEEI